MFNVKDSKHSCVSGEGQATRGLQAGASRVRVRGENPDHGLQPHE